MAAIGAEYCAINKSRSKLVMTITKQAGLSWFSLKLQESDFITQERASGVMTKLGISDEDKVSSLLEAVEAKIKSTQQPEIPFRIFVEILESEACLQGIGQALQYDCQMMRQASQNVSSGQSLSESKLNSSMRTEYSSDDPGCNSTVTTDTSSLPKPFTMQGVGPKGHVFIPRESLSEESERNEDTDGSDMNAYVSASKKTAPDTGLSMGFEDVDPTSSSSSTQTSTVSTHSRIRDLQDHVGSEVSAIVAKKDEQIGSLKGQLKIQLQEKIELRKRVEEQQKQIDALTTEKEGLESELQEKKKQLTEKSKLFSEKTQELEKCNLQLTQEKQEVETLKQKVETLEQQLAETQQKVDQVRSQKEEEITQLRKDLYKKAEEIRQKEGWRKEEVAELKLELKEKEKDVLRKEKELAQKREQLAQKGEELANTKAELAEKDSMIVRLEAETERRKSNEAIAELQKSNQDKDDKIAKLLEEMDQEGYTMPCTIQ